MLASGLSTLAIGKTNTTTTQTITLSFAQPITTITTVNAAPYTELAIQGADMTLASPGAPAVPMKTTVLQLPFGTTVTDVSLVPRDIQTMTLSYPVAPSPQIVVKDTSDVSVDQAVYASANYYPNTWFDYSTGAGLNDQGQHVTFLVIRTFPARISPATNTVQYFKNAVVTIHSKTPAPKTFGTGCDLLIIAPKVFSDTLQPLIQEKQGHGVNTTLLTLEDIYATYTGYDEPEQIKYAIKAAVEDQGVTYVLLVGGLKGYLFGNGGRDDANKGVKAWYFPVRYTNMDEGQEEGDRGFISDLYFADLYNTDASFSSWDSNNDHIYGYWKGSIRTDTVDLYPDVAVGRLSARNTMELKIMVDKILSYEGSAADPNWFKNIVLVGGDTDNDPATDVNEGELITSTAYNESMTSFTPVKMYVSNRNTSDDFTPTPKNLERVINEGSGFLFFDGHGNPLSWNTHWHGMYNWTKGSSPGGLNIYEMIRLKNKDKLPVCIVGGCHNSMINVSLFWTLQSKNANTWCYGQPAFRCWSEQLMAMRNGGAIAVVGSSALSYGMDGLINGTPACTEGLGGFVERTFLQTYNTSMVKTYGLCWVGSINRYLIVWPGMADFGDAKTVEEWLALGDPSLLIGGYS
jgi:hypothetical protein